MGYSFKFQGEETFRLALKVDKLLKGSSWTLTLLTANLHQLGMKATAVSVRDLRRDGTTSCESKLVQKTNPDDQSLQMFTITKMQQVFSPTNSIHSALRVYISDTMDDYRFQRLDSLLKDQLWLAAASKLGTDIELIASQTGEIFSAHKCILAARSSIFAETFRSLHPYGYKSSKKNRLEIDGDSSVVKKFLQFIYTGRLTGFAGSFQLLQLASNYKIKTLESLCRAALCPLDWEQMTIVAFDFNLAATTSCSSVRQEYAQLTIYFFIISPTN